MVSVLRIKNKKFFIDTLKAFNDKRQVTFDLSEQVINISSLEPPYIYLSIDSSVFSIDSPVSFTIRIDELINNITKLESSLVILDDSFRLVWFENINSVADSLSDNEYRNNIKNIFQYLNDEYNYSFIDIPFINPISSNYNTRTKFSTKLLIQKELIKNLITGFVRYTIRGDTLILTKQTPEYEEVMEVEVDVLEASNLDFYCSNVWIESVTHIYEMISTMLFCFSMDLLSIKFLLKGNEESYLEIQINEMERL